MSRVTPQTSAGTDFAWADDTWYPVLLKGYEAQPEGRPITYQGKTRKHPWVTLDITWVLVPPAAPEEDDVWVRDFVDLKLSPNRDGKPSNCRLLICCLGGRDPRQEPTPWIDNTTFEFGFGPNAETDTPAGRIVTGLRLQVKGTVKENEKGHFLKVERYAPASITLPPQVAVAPPAATPPQLSEDGRWQWNGTGWVPVAAGAASASTPAQTSLI